MQADAPHPVAPTWGGKKQKAGPVAKENLLEAGKGHAEMNPRFDQLFQRAG